MKLKDEIAASPDPERVARQRHGRWAENVAAAFLMLHGYRILERRHKTPFGEIDLIALRRRRIAFVEVKQRRTLAEGEAALTARQAKRVARAAQHWIGRHPALVDHEQGFDAIIVVPWGWPVLMLDALQPV